MYKHRAYKQQFTVFSESPAAVSARPGIRHVIARFCDYTIEIYVENSKLICQKAESVCISHLSLLKLCKYSSTGRKYFNYPQWVVMKTRSPCLEERKENRTFLLFSPRLPSLLSTLLSRGLSSEGAIPL